MTEGPVKRNAKYLLNSPRKPKFLFQNNFASSREPQWVLHCLGKISFGDPADLHVLTYLIGYAVLSSIVTSQGRNHAFILRIKRGNLYF